MNLRKNSSLQNNHVSISASLTTPKSLIETAIAQS